MGFDLGSIFKGGAQGLISGIGDAVKNVTEAFKIDPAVAAQLNEKVQELVMTHQEKMQELAEAQYETQLKDTDSARQMQIAALKQNDWLSRNYIHLLSTFISFVWGGLTVYLLLNMLNILKTDPSVNMTAVLGVYSGLSGIEGIIINFYFGSSKSSQAKDDTIATIAKQP